MSIYREKISGARADRPQLAKMMAGLKQDDTVIVTKIDRLARSVGDLCAIIKRIEAKGATLRILAMNLDTSTPTGRLMLNVIGSVAQFEREVMLERQREGIARAKADGRYKGRAPTARRKAEDIHRLAKEGKTREVIARELGIGVASVYRVLRQQAVPLSRVIVLD